MRLLLDTCISRSARELLAGAGHDVLSAAEWPEDPGDEEIIRRANDANRVLVTLDKDFGELVIVHKLQHAGIVRLVGFSAARQGPACEAVLKRYELELAEGAIITVEPSRVRVRPK